MSYPRIIKEAALEKLFHTDLSLRHIADELGIPRATLHGWKRKYQMIKNNSETVNTPAESWPGQLVDFSQDLPGVGETLSARIMPVRQRPDQSEDLLP